MPSKLLSSARSGEIVHMAFEHAVTLPEDFLRVAPVVVEVGKELGVAEARRTRSGPLVEDVNWAMGMIDVLKADGATHVPDMHILFWQSDGRLQLGVDLEESGLGGGVDAETAVRVLVLNGGDASGVDVLDLSSLSLSSLFLSSLFRKSVDGIEEDLEDVGSCLSTALFSSPGSCGLRSSITGLDEVAEKDDGEEDGKWEEALIERLCNVDAGSEDVATLADIMWIRFEGCAGCVEGKDVIVNKGC